MRKDAKDPRPLEAILGSRLKGLREGASKRQEDVSQRARDLGLDWTRAVVAAIEGGNRELSALELLLLPEIVRLLGVQGDVDLPALLADIPPIRTPAGAVLKPTVLQKVAAGSVRLIGTSDLAGSPLMRQVQAQVGVVDEARRYGVDSPTYLRARQDAQGEAEQRVARGWRADPIRVALAARRLWGHSLSAERDARVRDETDPDRARALRGRVTRLLKEELRSQVKRGR